MRAQNLTISIPADKCDKKCPYCISRITWQTVPDLGVMLRNVKKVRRLASIAGVTNVLITSKKEPFMNIDELYRFISEFSENHWLEIQTNGIHFIKHYKELSKDMWRAGVNVMAFSVDNLKAIKSLTNPIDYLNKFGVISRLCINITRHISDKYSFKNIMDEVIVCGDVRQVLFRNINYPSNADPNSPEVLWIDNNVTPEGYISLYKQMVKMDLDRVRVIPQTGVTIYDYNGISVCFSDYCIQETNMNDDIRSLIFQDDGHVYTSWNHRSSILF